MDYKPGTKCFAKVKGYSPWPARIDVLPDDVKVPRGKYPIFFYGTHEVSYVSAKDIYDFDKYRHIYGIFKEKNPKFNDGIREIEDNPNIYQLGIDKNAVTFLSQFYKFDLDKMSSENPTNLPTITVKEIKNPIKSSPRPYRKRQHLSIDSKDSLEPVNKVMKLDNPPKTNEEKVVDPDNVDIEQKVLKLEDSPKIKDKDSSLSPLKKLPPTEDQIEKNEINSENLPSHVEEEKIENVLKKENLEVSIILQDVLSDIPSLRRVPDNPRGAENPSINNNKEDISLLCKSEDLNVVLNSFKSPIKTSNTERPKRASAVKFKQNFLSYLKALSTNQKFPNKKPELLLRLKKDNDRFKKHERKSALLDERLKMKSEMRKHSMEEHKMFVDYNQNQSVRLKHSNSTDQKEENNLRIISKLSIIDKEIKRSLIVGHENSEKCRIMMNSLLELNNLTLVLLCQVPEIVVTIRKCRRYKKDDTIKARACQIFYKFLQIYELAELEEKIEAGTELLKRDSEHCKSAQVLMDELFVVDRSQTSGRQKVQPSLVLSSPSSAQSLHSSANNTPLLGNNEPGTDDPPEQNPTIVSEPVPGPVTESQPTLDPDTTDINKLVREGVLELIESYYCDDSQDSCSGPGESCHARKTSDTSSTTSSTPITNSNSAVTKKHQYHQKQQQSGFMFLIDDVELYKQLGV